MNPNHSGETGTMRDRATRYIEASKEYTSAGERERLIADWERKEHLAEGVVQDFRRRAGEPRGKRILEVGFGNGIQLAAFARAGGQLSGLEVNPVLYHDACEHLLQEGIRADVRLYDGKRFPFADATFDAAYSISVLEHTSDPQMLLSEVARVLAPGGVCYLAFPNRLMPRETHTRIWFLSYLPRAFAARVLRLFGRDTITELNLHFISYRALRRMLETLPFKVRMEAGRGKFPQRVIKQLLAYMGVHHSAILPHIMVVLEKQSA